jgi:hypothetical protein
MKYVSFTAAGHWIACKVIMLRCDAMMIVTSQLTCTVYFATTSGGGTGASKPGNIILGCYNSNDNHDSCSDI